MPLRDPEQVIAELAESLDLSMFDAGKILVATDHVPIAAWAYDTETGKEEILLNRGILARLDNDLLINEIRHEVLHRSLYAEGYEFIDREIGNISLDCSVNKVQFLADPDTIIRRHRAIGDPTPTGTPLDLLRTDFQRGQIAPDLQPIWDGIWANKKVPSPFTIYFALMQDIDNVREKGKNQGAGIEPEKGEKEEPEIPDATPDDQQGQMSMFDNKGDIKPIDEKPAKTPNPRNNLPKHIMVHQIPEEPLNTQVADRGQKLSQTMVNQISSNLNATDYSEFCSSWSNTFEHMKVVPEKTRTASIEDYLSTIRAQQECNDAANDILKALGLDPRVEIMPGNLSPTGYMMYAVGVSEATGLFWNHIPSNKKPQVRIYVDTSPSMGKWATKTVYIIGVLKDSLPATMYGFAGDVRECTTEDFSKGEYYKGYTTYFDAVIEDILANSEDLSIIFTDGQSSVSDENKNSIINSGKRIFTIFCGSPGDNNWNGLDLRDISESCHSLVEK